MTWLRFFLGTPRRFMATFIVLGLVSVVINPDILTTAVNRFVYAINPLIAPVAILVIVFVGLRFILSGLRR